MRGKHRRSAQVRDDARLEALRADYSARLASLTQQYAEDENVLRQSIADLRDRKPAEVDRLAKAAIDQARAETERLEKAFCERWDLFCVVLADAMFSVQGGDAAWDPGEEQLQRFSDALGLPTEVVLVMREQAMSHVE